MTILPEETKKLRKLMGEVYLFVKRVQLAGRIAFEDNPTKQAEYNLKDL